MAVEERHGGGSRQPVAEYGRCEHGGHYDDHHQAPWYDVNAVLTLPVTLDDDFHHTPQPYVRDVDLLNESPGDCGDDHSLDFEGIWRKPLACDKNCTKSSLKRPELKQHRRQRPGKHQHRPNLKNNHCKMQLDESNATLTTATETVQASSTDLSSGLLSGLEGSRGSPLVLDGVGISTFSLLNVENVALDSSLSTAGCPSSTSSAAHMDASGKNGKSASRSSRKPWQRTDVGGLGRNDSSTSTAPPRQRTLQINEEVLERLYNPEIPLIQQISPKDRLWSSYNSIYESGDEGEYYDHYYPISRSERGPARSQYHATKQQPSTHEILSDGARMNDALPVPADSIYSISTDCIDERGINENGHVHSQESSPFPKTFKYSSQKSELDQPKRAFEGAGDSDDSLSPQLNPVFDKLETKTLDHTAPPVGKEAWICRRELRIRSMSPIRRVENRIRSGRRRQIALFREGVCRKNASREHEAAKNPLQPMPEPILSPTTTDLPHHLAISTFEDTALPHVAVGPSMLPSSTQIEADKEDYVESVGRGTVGDAPCHDCKTMKSSIALGADAATVEESTSIDIDDTTLRTCNRTSCNNEFNPGERNNDGKPLQRKLNSANVASSIPSIDSSVRDATVFSNKPSEATAKQPKIARDTGPVMDPFRRARASTPPPHRNILHHQNASRKIMRTSFGKYFPTSQSCPNSPVAAKTLRQRTKRVEFADLTEHSNSSQSQSKADAPIKLPFRSVSPPRASTSSETSPSIDRWVMDAKVSLMKMPMSSSFHISDEVGTSGEFSGLSTAKFKTRKRRADVNATRLSESIEASENSMPSLEDIEFDTDDEEFNNNTSQDASIGHNSFATHVVNLDTACVRLPKGKGADPEPLSDVCAPPSQKKSNDENTAIGEIPTTKRSKPSMLISLMDTFSLETTQDQSESRGHTIEERLRPPSRCDDDEHGGESINKVKTASNKANSPNGRNVLCKDNDESQQAAGELSEEVGVAFKGTLLVQSSTLEYLAAPTPGSTTTVQIECGELKRKESCCSNDSTLNLMPWTPPVPSLPPTGEVSISYQNVPSDVETAMASCRSLPSHSAGSHFVQTTGQAFADSTVEEIADNQTIRKKEQKLSSTKREASMVSPTCCSRKGISVCHNPGPGRDEKSEKRSKALSMTAVEMQERRLSVLERHMEAAKKAGCTRISSRNRDRGQLPPSGRSVASTGSPSKSSVVSVVSTSTLASASDSKPRRGRRSHSTPRPQVLMEDTNKSRPRPSTGAILPSKSKEENSSHSNVPQRHCGGKQDGDAGSLHRPMLRSSSCDSGRRRGSSKSPTDGISANTCNKHRRKNSKSSPSRRRVSNSPTSRSSRRVSNDRPDVGVVSASRSPPRCTSSKMRDAGIHKDDNRRGRRDDDLATQSPSTSSRRRHRRPDLSTKSTSSGPTTTQPSSLSVTKSKPSATTCTLRSDKSALRSDKRREPSMVLLTPQERKRKPLTSSLSSSGRKPDLLMTPRDLLAFVTSLNLEAIEQSPSTECA